MFQYSKKQLVSTERQIRGEFEKLHQFLREEEEARLAALRKEEEEKGKTIAREMKNIQDQISSLTESITAVKQEFQKREVSFLKSYKHTQTFSRAQYTLPDPQLVSGALIDVAKYLSNLQFRVWENMQGIVKYTPVILDPNTASRWLSLSDDLTSVRHLGKRQQLPDNPERNTICITGLGSEGFSSGKLSWEVEVEDHPHWYIGVAKESIKRQEEVQYFNPEFGVWSLKLNSGQYKKGIGGTLTLKRRPQRIRVQLDYDRGEVSFYDTKDMTHIYTFRDTFTERLYPFFSNGKVGDDGNTGI
ncbi:zinc-binding protein A33-like [Salmo salar]|uniref:Zinc-binding protein A33-like n=1 Tax=Salmo salar TaxID=8030 RepID=A0ABM3CXA5_SALSA|nr:zinc-binding protein A33-like [Salmo salar]